MQLLAGVTCGRAQSGKPQGGWGLALRDELMGGASLRLALTGQALTPLSGPQFPHL